MKLSILLLSVILLTSSLPFIQADGGVLSEPGTNSGEAFMDIDMFLNGTVGNNGTATIFENITVYFDTPLCTTYGNISFRNVTMLFAPDSRLINHGNLTVADIDGKAVTDHDRSKMIGNESAPAEVSNDRYEGNITIGNSLVNRVILAGTIYEEPTSMALSGSSLVECDVIRESFDIRDCFLENTRINMGHSNITRSLLVNSSLFARGTHLRHLEFSNSTFRTDSDTDLEDLDFRVDVDKPFPAVQLLGGHSQNVRNITIKGYETGILKEGGSVNIFNVTVEDCQIGVFAYDSTSIYVKRTEISNCTVAIGNSGLVSLDDCLVRGGTIAMSDHSLLTYRCEFISMDSISDVMTGSIRNSTFISMEIGLDQPMGTTVTGNRFLSCKVAISDPSGCLIYHNSFIDNDEIDDGPASTGWYEQDLEQGNYYSSYKGLDDGSNDRVAYDGIGDTDIPFLGRDLYPFMKDLAWEMPDIPRPNTEHLLGTGIVNLSWSSIDTTGSFVQRSPSETFSMDVRTWSLRGNNISIENNPNGTQFFRVAVYNPIGFRGWSNPIKVRIDQIPLSPVNIVINEVQRGNSLEISWEHRGEDIERTLVYYTGRNYQPPPREVFHPMNTLTLEGLANGVEHTIFLLTEDSSGQISLPTANYTGVPVDSIPPPPPKELRADVISNTSIELFWDPPSIQDISGYEIYRKGPQDEELQRYEKVSRFSVSYVDRELLDNTTYVYAMRAIDDDGPLSVLSEKIEVTTFHYNRDPEFNGSFQVISLFEDQEVYRIPIADIASDPDGDRMIIKVEDSEKVDAEISGDFLIIEPRENEAGIGFIRIQASDGEVSTVFIIDILIEEVPDPPSDVRILFPINGSVYLPGSPVILRGEAFDPDVEYGDILTYRWISSKDGPLNGQGSEQDHDSIILTPGLHTITMEVFDTSSTIITRNVTVMVSLWGWSKRPWNGLFIRGSANEEGGEFLVRIENDSPIQLIFSIGPTGETDPTSFGERGLIVSPSSTGDMKIPFIGDHEPGEEVAISLLISAETTNGTFGGWMELNFTIEVVKEDEDEGPQYLIIVLIVISALIAIVGVIIFLTLGKMGYRIRSYQKVQDDDGVQEDGAANGK